MADLNRLSLGKRKESSALNNQEEKYQKVHISPDICNSELQNVNSKIQSCLELREKWISYYATNRIETHGSIDHSPTYDIFSRPVPNEQLSAIVRMLKGVAKVESEHEKITSKLRSPPSFDEFVADYDKVRQVVHSGPVRSHSFKRLALLEAKFNIHKLLNGDKELTEQKEVAFRDLSTCRKVDTHVHHSSCMTQQHLLRFIRRKLGEAPDDIVSYHNGTPITLREAFAGLQLTLQGLSLDTLDMHAHNTYQRFDRFNNKFNPAGEGLLREIFLKTENALSGRYLAEITQEVISTLQARKYTIVEWRISIYGRKKSEWRSLAQWFYAHRLAHYNVRWLIQVPRIYHVYRAANQVASFGEMLRNIFEPLFENTINPASDPALFYFLQAIVGFDSVDDESQPEKEMISAVLPEPDAYTHIHNPPYAYWMYYMGVNIAILNQLRASRGWKPMEFRPHAGEAGDEDHLISTFLIAHKINHGLLLWRTPALHYCYYLAQIGIAMSPLCNSKLFVSCHKSPCPRYFKQGLNLSLSTDTPLMAHHTEDAMEEEYAVCAQMWKLSSVDLCELARNSVLQSSLETSFKKHFLGSDFSDSGRMNVPTIRMDYREHVLREEWEAVHASIIDV